MSEPTLVPSLIHLTSALDRAETELSCADMIDNFERRQREMAHWSARVADLKAQIDRCGGR